MRISRRTSGGRGEYEISGAILAGLQARDLLGRIICVDLGSGLLINTGLELKSQGGKLRLRIVAGDMQIQKQLATALMMPEPIRSDAGLGAGAPVLQKTRYAIENIEVEQVLLVNPNLAVLSLGKMEIRNRSHLADEIRVPQRAGS